MQIEPWMLVLFFFVCCFACLFFGYAVCLFMLARDDTLKRVTPEQVIVDRSQMDELVKQVKKGNRGFDSPILGMNKGDSEE